jgi:diaminohydroxyphosphoribosylaminopyrimidine deaminase/5-amino-6-(5-phosphoribosylamino)uracil reductase
MGEGSNLVPPKKLPMSQRSVRSVARGASMKKNEKFMSRAFELAKKGKGKVSPNPLVGSLIVKNGRIVGEGYHRKAGTEHAEVIALRRAQHLARGAHMYVNLEPCSHYGKTPPCTDSILKAGIREIYIATKDTNPLVSGKGIAALRQNGMVVHVGILESEARRLNEYYFSYMEKKRPFILLKIAQTIDGKIADSSGNSKWITSETSRKRVHALRSEVDAVLTGIGTVLADDPLLTPRLVRTRKEPLRVVLDSNLRFPLSASIARKGTIVATMDHIKPRKKQRLCAQGVAIWEFRQKGCIPLTQLLRRAYEEKIQSILIEGGRDIASAFLDQHLVDRIYFFIANKILGKGLSPFDGLRRLSLKNAIPLAHTTVERIGGDILVKSYVYGNH